jgi:hypothetical protein
MNQRHQQHDAAISLQSCQKLLLRLEHVRSNIQRDFGQKLPEHQPMLHLALNEAESLAFQTPFPHLFFPTLAEEKAGALARWAARQQRVNSRELAAA